MQRIDMNFQKPAYRPRRSAGWLLLLTGLAILLEMGFSYDRLQHDRAVMSEVMQTSHIRLDTPRDRSNIHSFDDKDIAGVHQIVERLSAPWDVVFVGLESINNSNVAILSIQPDIKAGVLQIQGEAKDYAATLTLVAQLREIKPFTNVFLSKHEVKRDDPQHPVAFTLSLHWKKPS